MIIVRLLGGMGNQMFQYAAGRALALANRDTLKLDLGYFRNIPPGDVPRKYELHNFGVTAEEATEREVRRFSHHGRGMRALKMAQRLLGLGAPGYFAEPHMRYVPEFHRLTGDIYLDGYWQSQRYFEPVAETIRTEFAPPFSGNPASVPLLEAIRGSNSVCINVRRGDFLTNSFHGCMGTDYFQRGREIIAGVVPEPKWFVFSDDVQWCVEEFGGIPDTTVVGHEHAGTDFIDYLFLMSSCKHFIIPNSSFAWWAAWLCDNPAKRVIAPQRWFNDPSVNSSDLIPPQWVRI